MTRAVAPDWKPTVLGNYFAVKHGFAFKGEHFVEDGEHIVLTPGNFTARGMLKLRGRRDKYYAGPVPPEYVLSENDLLIVMTDLKQDAPILGAAAFIPESDRFLHNQRLGKVVDLNDGELDARFLRFLLNCRMVRAQIVATATGSTVKHTAPDRICQVKAHIPPIETQRKIASVLSAFEELIENNARRIEILEAMAQAIYREWFIDFRFPGHEDVEVVDSEIGRTPANWQVSVLGEHLELLYGKALKADDRHGGEVPVYGSSGVVGWHDEHLVEGPGIIVGRKGNVGSVHWSDGSFHPIDTTFFVRSDLPLRYVYFNLVNQDFIGSDTAVPGLNRDHALRNRMIVPPRELLKAWERVVGPIMVFRRTLSLQRVCLREIRDLLLPRLVSGEVDVSDLDVDTSELSA